MIMGEHADASRSPRAGRRFVPRNGEPLWRILAPQYRGPADRVTQKRIRVAWDSEAMRTQRQRLEALGLSVDPDPALWKYLPGPYLRLFFRVEGDSPAIEEGQVVALVLLHDPSSEQTLYAHPVHAGPNANPLLKHLFGPMAGPKSQEGRNGDRATLRLLEHKRAIWDRFLHERRTLGANEAGRRWRERYFWSLVRLYFCERCPGCRWGTPQFEGLAGEPYRPAKAAPLRPHLDPDVPTDVLQVMRDSSVFSVETAYAQRGGFNVQPEPMVTTRLDATTAFVACPTDAEYLEGGALVGLAAYVGLPRGPVHYAHVLTAGPEPELVLLHGDRGLGLPPPQPAQAGVLARRRYVQWRRRAWSRFWLRELEEGPYAASRAWLREYWRALARLVGALRTAKVGAEPAHA